MWRALPTLGIIFAAFCIWLAVRIVSRRERWAIRTAAAAVVAIAAFSALCGLFGYLEYINGGGP